MSSCRSVDRAPTRFSGGHLFDSCRGLKCFLCPMHALVINSHFITELKIHHLYSIIKMETVSIDLQNGLRTLCANPFPTSVKFVLAKGIQLRRFSNWCQKHCYCFPSVSGRSLILAEQKRGQQQWLRASIFLLTKLISIPALTAITNMSL